MESHEKAKSKPGPAAYLLAVLGLGFIAFVGSVASQKHDAAPAASIAGRPDYCKNKPATYRLPECGLSDSERREIDELPAKKAAEAEAFYRYFSQQAHDICDRPVSQLSMQDIADCNKPGMRVLLNK